jgi:hypothetical protein
MAFPKPSSASDALTDLHDAIANRRSDHTKQEEDMSVKYILELPIRGYPPMLEPVQGMANALFAWRSTAFRAVDQATVTKENICASFKAV